MIPPKEIAISLYLYDPISGQIFSKKYHRKIGSLNVDGYLCISTKFYRVTAHRLAWLLYYGEWPDQIDHVNGVRSDNSIWNLRNVSISENNRNLVMPIHNTSGVVGVCYKSREGRWFAFIHKEGKQVSLGRFKNFDSAVAARRQAEIDYGYHKNHGQKKWDGYVFKAKRKGACK